MSGEFEIGLAATKLRPPTLPGNLVRRDRLDQVLDAGTSDHTRLLLVSAPAGSGKSTLLASWLAGRSEATAWLQAEEGDDDPARFWAYLVESIGQVSPSGPMAARLAVLAPGGDYDMVVSALITALADLADPLVIVVDDYHLISNDVIHRGMERLIELCPPQVTIVVSTRFDPPFRLGRLRVRNHLVEIRGEGLRFESTEAGGLLESGERSLSAGDVELLSGRTEGWAAGLVLAGLSLGQSNDATRFIEEFHGDDQLVVDYLSEEFLAGVSDDHRQRLLATSILEQLSGSLVDAVIGSSNGKRWLSETAAANQLVISLDRTGGWYRYHHLFRDLLRVEASDSIADQLPELHRRAAAWFESEGDHGRAVAHWLGSGDRRKAARVMSFYGPQLIADSQIETLRRVLNDLGDVARSDAVCALLWGWVEFIRGRYDAAEEWVAVTHQVASDEFDQTMTAPLRMNISLGRGDVNSALALARELADPVRLGGLASEQAVVAGGVLMWAGQSDEARSVLRVAVQKSEQSEMKSAHVLALIYQAIVEFDAGNSVAARLAATHAITTADELGIAAYYRLGPAYAIRASCADEGTADNGDVLDDARRAIDMVRKATGDLALAYVLTMCGDILVGLDDPEGLELLVEARVVVNGCPDPGVVARYLDRTESRHAIASAPVSVPAIVEQLTERETAVLRYLPTALSQREIANELFVSANTVKTHCGAIYRKLAVANRKAAVQTARDLGLL